MTIAAIKEVFVGPVVPREPMVIEIIRIAARARCSLSRSYCIRTTSGNADGF